MRNILKTLLFIFSFLIILNENYAQNSVGIGTESPNANAVLQLVSPTNNQGFLVPRLTTAQRTADSFVGRLTTADNGLMVFDTNLSTFFYWVANRWELVSGTLLTGGEGVTIDEEGVISVEADIPQDLILANNQLRITNNTTATVIDLTPYLNIQNASQVVVTPTTTLTSTTVQAALEELQAEILNPAGNMLRATYDPTNVNGNAFDLSTHTGTLPSTRITGLGTAATLNVGVGANNIVQLDGIGLPAVDGSRITGLSLSQFPGLGDLATLDVVGTTEIVDNSIVNDDISIAAQVAGTKIVPNFGTQNITTNGIITGGSIVGDGSGLTNVGVPDGTITAQKIALSTITNNNISATAAIDGTKIAPNFGAQNVTTTGTITGGSFVGNGSGLTNVGLPDGTITGGIGAGAKIASTTITNDNISATAAIAGTKIAPNFGSQNIVTTGTITGGSFVGNGSGLTNVGVPDGTITGGTGAGAKIASTTITNDNISATAAIAGTKVAPNFGSQNMVTTGSITGGSFFGDGAGLTNVSPWDLNSGNINRATGNVGIGVVTPNQKFHIGGVNGVDTYAKMEAGGTNANYSGILLTELGLNFGMSMRFEALNDNFHIATQDNSLIFTDLFTVRQNGNVGIGTTAPGAKLDIIGNLKITDGTEGAGKILVSDATGLATWQNATSTGWGVTGNAGMVDGTNFIGTTDAQPLNFRVNNIEAGSIDTNGNLFLGLNAGIVATGGSNTFIGNEAGNSTGIGNNNTFVGANSGVNNTDGGHNSFYGTLSGNTNTTGVSNTFVGYGAGQDNTTAGFNSFFGEKSGNSNTTGIYNSFFGAESGLNNTTASNNSFYGYQAGLTNTVGLSNSFFGASSGLNNTSGGSNAFFGLESGFSNTTGSGNSFYGSGAGKSNTTAFWNSFYGEATGFNNTIGQGNAFFGNEAGFNSIDGSSNVYVGRQAGFSSANGSFNTMVGSFSGQNNTASGNSFYGSNSGHNNTTASGNSFFGEYSGFTNTTGAENAFFGTASGTDNNANQNSFFGSTSGESNTSGFQNTFVGASAGRNNTTGSRNIGLGFNTLSANLTGSNNLALGWRADVTADGLTNANAIGYNAKVGASNTLVLGGTGTDAVNVGIGTTTPNHLLQLNSATNTATMQITNTTTGSTNLDGTWMQVNSVGAFSINNRENASLSLGTNTNTRLLISSTGDVGIGNVAPTSKLDVTGTVKATDFSYAAPVQNIYAISPVDFIVMRTLFSDDFVATYGTNGISVRPASANSGTLVTMAAPVHLPDGAVITQIDVLGSNNSTIDANPVILMEKSYSTASTQIPVTTIPANTGAISTFTNNTLNYTINNDTDNYYIYVSARTNQTTITGIRIYYNVTKPD